MPNIENLLRFNKPQRGEGHEEQREENLLLSHVCLAAKEEVRNESC